MYWFCGRQRVLCALVATIGLAGCVSDGGGNVGPAPDSGMIGADSGENCQVPSNRPEWLLSMQSEVVAKLSGAQELSPGIRLSDRATNANRTQAQSYIATQLTNLGYEVELHDYGSGVNVIAKIEGENPGFYVLGAHYDSVPGSPGANDNATGVAAVLATARYLKELGCTSKQGVHFVFFDEEELQLIGSRAYAQKLKTEGADLRGAYTLDQLGWDMDGDRRIEIELPGAGMMQGVAESIARHGLNVPIVETSTVGSDHTAFREQGYPALGVTEEYVNGDTTPHYHLSSDRFQTVDFEYLATSTEVMLGLFADLSL